LLNNKVIVITGAAGVAGKKFVKTVVKQKGIAVIADINENR
jgi:FlaA1/EpsC-like NDP-sugar epimerase